MTCAVGIAIQQDLLTGTDLAAFATAVRDAGLDHVSVGDHVSHRGGQGIDGLVAAAALLAVRPELQVVVGAFQLALRHPLVAARQLATATSFGPGRLVLAVGAGGDDRREVANCGVDPRQRGRRLNESLDVLTRLIRGEVIDHHGAHFDLEQASIAPAAPVPPLVIAGSGEAAIDRAAAYGSGWLGLLCTARRYRETRQEIIRRTAPLGRPAPDWFGLNVWCGPEGGLESSLRRWFGPAAPRLRHLCGVGEGPQIAAWLADYVSAGATRLSISVPAADALEAVEQVAELAGLLHERLQADGIGTPHP
ncbi:LLM class flavin-dependent oxidoreductase [Acrocarpospora catenulata]|uniref:LLM class flavin-dependent oxidoreductase n=1 Tax=Acrocarpospora catenulata TaxID=2836182 RepID=UPI001BD9A04B|nr:LLM class flavin-dependent oxidoreductase [Acrocarpospora catenulata]